MPSSTTSAGVHAGQTATENEAPSATAPHVLAAPRARKGICGIGSLIHPGHASPITIDDGPSTSPHSRPIKRWIQPPPRPTTSPSSACVTIMPSTNIDPNSTARCGVCALVT